MLKTSRSLLLASAFILIGAASGSVQAADDPIFDQAKQAFDAIGKGSAQPSPPLVIVTSGDTQIVKPAAPAPLPAAPANLPVEGPACAQGKCAAKTEDSTKQDDGKSCCSGLKKIGHWFSCDRPKASCGCCPRPSPYCPSVYAWFPLVPGTTCATPGGCAPPCGMVAAGKHFDNPLPKPQLPSFVSKEKPLVPGSSTVLANDQETTTASTPINYKSMPIAPNASLPANVNGSR